MQNSTTTRPDTAAPSTAVISSISIDGLLAARDQAVAAFTVANDLLNAAAAALDRFDVSLPEVLVMDHNGARQQSRALAEVVEGFRRYGSTTLAPHCPPRLTELIDQACWSTLFSRTSLDQIMDKQTRDEFNAKTCAPILMHHRDPADLLPPLTAENIEATFEALYERRGEFYGKAIEATFRALSWDYKTNAPYRFDEKIIVSYALEYWAAFQADGSISLGQACDKLIDLERVAHVVVGRPAPTSNTGLRSVTTAQRGEWTTIPSTQGSPLFEVKVFKNRNAHVRFLDTAVPDEMNRIMAARQPFAVGAGRKGER